MLSDEEAQHIQDWFDSHKPMHVRRAGERIGWWCLRLLSDRRDLVERIKATDAWQAKCREARGWVAMTYATEVMREAVNDVGRKYAAEIEANGRDTPMAKMLTDILHNLRGECDRLRAHQKDPRTLMEEEVNEALAERDALKAENDRLSDVAKLAEENWHAAGEAAKAMEEQRDALKARVSELERQRTMLRAQVAVIPALIEKELKIGLQRGGFATMAPIIDYVHMLLSEGGMPPGGEDA